MRARNMQPQGSGPDTQKPDHWSDAALCARAPERDKQSFTGAFPTLVIAQDINRRYCAKCPVRNECLKWAIGDWAFTGIAGGMAFVGEKAAGRARRMDRIAAEA